jgi:hypothetical protein
VEDGLRAVGQAHARLGGPDPRKDSHGDIDFWIQRQIKAYTKVDSPSRRLKPVPIFIIIFIMAEAFGYARTDAEMAIADMITIAFFLLLQPSEYTAPYPMMPRSNCKMSTCTSKVSDYICISPPLQISNQSPQSHIRSQRRKMETTIRKLYKASAVIHGAALLRQQFKYSSIFAVTSQDPMRLWPHTIVECDGHSSKQKTLQMYSITPCVSTFIERA